jgi:hypothetical protein
MPWCPKCYIEYDGEGADSCADCLVPLVDELPAMPEEEPQQNLLQKPPLRDLGEPVLLITIDGHLEADMLLGLLTEHHIPAFKKSHDAKAYFSTATGTNSLGVDIYVPQQLLNKAMAITDTIFPPESAVELETSLEDLTNDLIEDFTEDLDEDTQEEEKDSSYPMWRWLLLGVLLIVLISMLRQL